MITCLNCEQTVAQVVTGARSYLGDALVVDDGSSDRTGELARAASAEGIRHPERRGKGAALQTGLDWARERGFTHLFTVDGDGQHLTGEMPA